MAHSPPKPSPCKPAQDEQLLEILSKAAQEGEDRIPQDRDLQHAHAAEAVGERAGKPAAERGGDDGDGADRAGGAGRHAPDRDDRGHDVGCKAADRSRPRSTRPSRRASCGVPARSGRAAKPTSRFPLKSFGPAVLSAIRSICRDPILDGQPHDRMPAAPAGRRRQNGRPPSATGDARDGSAQPDVVVVERQVVDAAVGRRDPAGDLAGLGDLLHQAFDEAAVGLGGQPVRIGGRARPRASIGLPSGSA